MTNATDTRSQPRITLVDDLRMDAEMLGDGYQKGLTELWHSEVVREAAKHSSAAADRIERLEKALKRIDVVCAHHGKYLSIHMADKISAIVGAALPPIPGEARSP